MFLRSGICQELFSNREVSDFDDSFSYGFFLDENAIVIKAARRKVVCRLLRLLLHCNKCAITYYLDIIVSVLLALPLNIFHIRPPMTIVWIRETFERVFVSVWSATCSCLNLHEGPVLLHGLVLFKQTFRVIIGSDKSGNKHNDSGSLGMVRWNGIGSVGEKGSHNMSLFSGIYAWIKWRCHQVKLQHRDHNRSVWEFYIYANLTRHMERFPNLIYGSGNNHYHAHYIYSGGIAFSLPI